MKRFFSLFTVLSALALFSVSCGDDPTEDYIPPTVVGIDASYRPDIVAVVPGSGRVEVYWNLNSGDRVIDQTYIYWAGGAGAFEVDIADAECISEGYYRQKFDIAEGEYDFFVRNIDSDRYLSANSSTLTATVYGDDTAITGRPIESVSFMDSNCTLTWGESESCVGSTVTYTRTNSSIESIESDAAEEYVLLSDAVEEGDVTVESLHVPYRTFLKASLTTDEEDMLESLNVKNIALDTLYTTTSRKFLGSDTEFIYIYSLKELWELLNEWEDYTIDGATSDVTVSGATYEQRVANLARKSNKNVVMLPSPTDPDAYTVTADDAEFGKDGVTPPIFNNDAGFGDRASILFVSGDNNYFDFSAVKITVHTDAFAKINAYSDGLNMVAIYGDGNTVRGYTHEDVGELYISPGGECQNIGVDGRNNILEDFDLIARGSIPYGYGELFGKGSTNTISHTKHSVLLIRGDYNIVRNSNFVSESYGHLIFMQSARYGVIENVYIEGRVSTTDAVLAERGFGTAADLVNFLTAWGYTVPEGYSLPLNEDGFRKYTSGTTYMRDTSTLLYESYSHNTLCSTVRNSTAVNTRSGVSFRLGSATDDNDNKDIIENVTAINCGAGFGANRYQAIGTAAVPCRGDAKYGPVLGMAYGTQETNTDVGIKSHITLIPYEGNHYNKSGQISYIQGHSHYIYFYEDPALMYEDGLWIKLGGVDKVLGSLNDKGSYEVTNVELYNHTGYPVLLGWNAKCSASTRDDRGPNMIYVKTKNAYGEPYIAPIDVEDVNGNVITVGSDAYRSLFDVQSSNTTASYKYVNSNDSEHNNKWFENEIYDIDDPDGGLLNTVYRKLTEGYQWADYDVNRVIE